VIGSIGCGRGATEARLVTEGRVVHGVDISALAIEAAALRLTSARVVTTAERSPFPVESLDGLILADVLEHLSDAPSALSTFVEMVKPGGWIVISVPNMRFVEALWQFVILGDWPESAMGTFDATHVQVMTHRRLKRWTQTAGLIEDRWFGAYVGGFTRRNTYRFLDYLTLHLFRGYLQFEVQARFRKMPH
jgi:2-polyprenyl-3-methyl-5-hydroxy-6-metoxy-1,4-benzoquinol methylase